VSTDETQSNAWLEKQVQEEVKPTNGVEPTYINQFSQDTKPATCTVENYKPLPEVATLISNLKLLLDSLDGTPQWEFIDPLAKAINLLEKGEPFHPEPHPDSGQAKWREMAKGYARNEEFYRGIVTQVGRTLGEKAYTADDGTVGTSVLALKVPELVKELKEVKEQKEQYNGRP
jgi:hypothetical protein